VEIVSNAINIAIAGTRRSRTSRKKRKMVPGVIVNCSFNSFFIWVEIPDTGVMRQAMPPMLKSIYRSSIAVFP